MAKRITSGKPRGKPFKPGALPNPGGVPKGEASPRRIDMDARPLTRDHSLEAVKKLISIMNNPEATHTAQLIAGDKSLIAATAGPPQSGRFMAAMFRPTAETMFSKLSKFDLLSLASASERKDFYRGLIDPEMLRLRYEWSFWGRPVRRCRPATGWSG